MDLVEFETIWWRISSRRAASSSSAKTGLSNPPCSPQTSFGLPQASSFLASPSRSSPHSNGVVGCRKCWRKSTKSRRRKRQRQKYGTSLWCRTISLRSRQLNCQHRDLQVEIVKINLGDYKKVEKKNLPSVISSTNESLNRGQSSCAAQFWRNRLRPKYITYISELMMASNAS